MKQNATYNLIYLFTFLIKKSLILNSYYYNTPELIKQMFNNDIINLPSYIENLTGKMIPIDNIQFISLDSSSQNTSGNIRTRLKDIGKQSGGKKLKYFVSIVIK